MNLCIISRDPSLHTLCHELANELGGVSISKCMMASEPVMADTYLWDMEAGSASSKTILPDRQGVHLLLVERSEAQQYAHLLPLSGVNLLLKPVSRATLQAFLLQACERTNAALPSPQALRADRDELLQCLLQTNLRLQEYDQDRTNFLARAIHDFRAPLTAITGYCGLLLSDDVESLTKEQRELLERMHQSAKKLSRMASAMFQLSIAPRAETTLALQPGDIGECIDQAVHEIMPAAQEKRLTLNVDAAPPMGALVFERVKLEQVLVNLLENACKFTPRLGSIEIRGYSFYWDERPAASRSPGTSRNGGQSIEREPNSYRIDIRDTGQGVPHTHIHKIFEEYTSYAGGTDRSGGGLGLAICRMIVNQHKGKIWAQANKEGGFFSFVIPFHVQAAGIEAVTKTLQVGAC